MEFLKILSRESWPRTLVILFMSAISGICGGLIIPLVLQAAENAVAGKYHQKDMLLIPLVSALLVIAKRVSQRQTAFVTERALENLVVGIADSIRHAELPKIEAHEPSRIISGIADAQTVSQAATKNVDILQNVILIFVCWFYVAWISRTGAVIFASALLLVVLIVELFQKLTEPLIRMEKEREGRLFALFDHILGGFKEIKMSPSRNDDLFEGHLRPLTSETGTVRARIMVLFSECRLSIIVCTFILIGIDVFILFSYYPQKIVLAILTLLLYITTPAMIILTALPDLARGKAAMERLCRLEEDLRGNSEEAEHETPAPERHGDFKRLCLKDIRFCYRTGGNGQGFSLGPLGFDIRAGSLVFVCGGNGSGKSTLLKLLAGLYVPDSGSFEMDGEPVAMSRHRHLFSTIFTDFHLFDGLYGIDDVDDGKVGEWLARMELASSAEWLGERFSTLDLSAGQRKRLALVVALLEDKPVYVFDEWAADQDPEFRRYFYEELLPAFRDEGKTVIAATHDDKYFHVADQVVRMEYGKITSIRSSG